MNKVKIKFDILGEPMGKQRPKVTVLGTSKYAHAYTPKETVQYESKVVNAYNEKLKELNLPQGKPLFDTEDEIHAIIFAYFKIPKSHFHFHKRTQTLDLDKEGELMVSGKRRAKKKPDCDNIAKIVLDALNGIAFPDDSQVVCLLVMKCWSQSNPRVEVILESGNYYETE